MTTSVTEAAVFVCRIEDLTCGRGVVALIGGEQVALFRVDRAAVYAVQQLDPYSGAHVMSRGIQGTRGDAVTVTSPMHKQVFDLRTGACLDALGKSPQHLRTWPVDVTDGGRVMVDPVPVHLRPEPLPGA
jgi:nitrite reductase (NADH) small subunit